MSNVDAITLPLYEGGFRDFDRLYNKADHRYSDYTPSTDWLSDATREIEMDAQGIIAKIRDVVHQQGVLLSIASIAWLSYSVMMSWFLN